MPQRRRKHAIHRRSSSDALSTLAELWDRFWSPPEGTCPKCGNTRIEYYDPFFFSPLRTLNGKRRLRCSGCRFVWRKSRGGRTLLDRFKAQV